MTGLAGPGSREFIDEIPEFRCYTPVCRKCFTFKGDK